MSFYGNQSAFYLLSNQLVSIGRTYGPDLIVPNIYRHSALVPNAIEYQQQQQQLVSLQYQHQNLLLKQQQQPTVLNRNPAHQQHHRKGLVLDRELGESSSQRLLDNDARPTTSDSHSETSSETSDDSEENGENSTLNLHSEIKFSIDRILSGDAKCTQSFTCKSRVKTEHEIDDERSNKADADVDEQAGDGYPETSNVTSFEWLHCTRYQPPKLQRSRKKDGGRKRKLGRNPRVPFTQHQVTELERKFRRTHYLSGLDVAELSTSLSLTETRVKIWFQNRRARERRSGHKKESSAESDRDAAVPTSGTLALVPGCRAGNSAAYGGMGEMFPHRHSAFNT